MATRDETIAQRRAVALERRDWRPDWLRLGGDPLLLVWRAGIALLALVALEQHLAAGPSPALRLALALPLLFLAFTAALPVVHWTGAWAGFLVLRGVADDLGLPDRGAALLEIDRWLGLGVAPGARLQRWLHVPGETGAVDLLALAVHASYFVVPHAVALGLWWWGARRQRPRVLRQYLLATLLVMAAGVVLHALLPSSPPWLQADGAGGIAIRRIAQGAGVAAADGSGVYLVAADQNPIAAFPSLHMALALVAALALWRASRVLGALGLLWAAAMGASLVYLGEHWLVDVLAGAALAALASAACFGSGWRQTTTCTQRRIMVAHDLQEPAAGRRQPAGESTAAVVPDTARAGGRPGGAARPIRRAVEGGR